MMRHDTLPRHRVEVVVRGDRYGVEGAERPEGASALLHLDEGDGVAQHLQPRRISLVKINTYGGVLASSFLHIGFSLTRDCVKSTWNQAATA